MSHVISYYSLHAAFINTAHYSSHILSMMVQWWCSTSVQGV